MSELSAPVWSEERKLAGLLHSLGSRLWKARIYISVMRHERGADLMWQQRYVDDVGELLIRLGYPAWASAPENTCCQSGCGNPTVHPHRSVECVYDEAPAKKRH